VWCFVFFNQQEFVIMMKHILRMTLVVAMLSPVLTYTQDGSAGGGGASSANVSFEAVIRRSLNNNLLQGGVGGLAARAIANRYMKFREGATQGSSISVGLGTVIAACALIGGGESGATHSGVPTALYLARLAKRSLGSVFGLAFSYFIWAPAKSMEQREREREREQSSQGRSSNSARNVRGG
jgi:hypothetical protein